MAVDRESQPGGVARGGSGRRRTHHNHTTTTTLLASIPSYDCPDPPHHTPAMVSTNPACHGSLQAWEGRPVGVGRALLGSDCTQEVPLLVLMDDDTTVF